MASKASALGQRTVQSIANMAAKLENHSAQKLTHANPALLKKIQEHEAVGSDAAHAATRQFIGAQRYLMQYRVVRFFEEARYLLSGAYWKSYSWKSLVFDARFLTQTLFLFIVGTIIGRASIYPPIAPGSPFVVGLENKPNPNY